MYIDQQTLNSAVDRLYGSAGHLIKIWFVLKHMGLSLDSSPIEIDTSNSTPSLMRLFSCGAADERFYVPFAHTPRYLTMKKDAARSIIQTTIQRWASSGSVVTCDPTEYLDISNEEGTKLNVSTSRRYPLGLGIDESGFALENGSRVSIPISAFSIWYGRKTQFSVGEDALDFLIERMLTELHISSEERAAIFVEDRIDVTTQDEPLSDEAIFEVCNSLIQGNNVPKVIVQKESFASYSRRIQSMVSGLNLPSWMRNSPETELSQALQYGSKSVLLYGPPRTGKTRAIDKIVERGSKNRLTIQIHDGWGYDNLIQGFTPDDSGNWGWTDGPLMKAVKNNVKYIVLEEINRTVISQALGEVFSLIEDSYRGSSNGITLRNGEKFYIPEDTVFIMTMNNLDKSTEEIDDALMGRVAAIEFPPRAEDLNELLSERKVTAELHDGICQLYAEIIKVYPLGHGYFAGFSEGETKDNFLSYYKTRIRPVLQNYFGDLKTQEVQKIDNFVDDLFV